MKWYDMIKETLHNLKTHGSLAEAEQYKTKMQEALDAQQKENDKYQKLADEGQASYLKEEERKKKDLLDAEKLKKAKWDAIVAENKAKAAASDQVLADSSSTPTEEPKTKPKTESKTKPEDILSWLSNIFGSQELLNPQGTAPTTTPTPTPTPTPTSTPTPDLTQGVGETISPGYQWKNGDKMTPIPDFLIPGINKGSQTYGVDPEILASQEGTEIGGYNYDVGRTGSSGEIGPGQIIPGYHTPKGMTVEEYTKKLQELQYNQMQQAEILSKYIKGQGGIYNGLRQYNAGSNLDRAGTYADEILRRVGMEQYIPSTLLGTIK